MHERKGDLSGFIPVGEYGLITRSRREQLSRRPGRRAAQESPTGTLCSSVLPTPESSL